MNLFGSRQITLLILSAMLLCSCDKDTQERIDRLEAELRSIRSDTRDEVAELKTRVISAESKLGFSQDENSVADRLKSVELSVDALRTLGARGNQTVYLRANMDGHSLLHTDHGTFLVRLDGLDIRLEEGGFNVHLSIGNPFGFAVSQFTLKGKHGGGTPELPEGQEYSLSNPLIRSWQENLTPFEQTISKTLAPLSWTSFDLVLDANSREELEVISFSMLVENTDITSEGIGGGEASSSLAHLKRGAEGASVMKTEYGAFLVNFVGVEESEVGTRVQLDIGNPYGFIIEECRLIGDFGPAIPDRQLSGSVEEYRLRMTAWTDQLQPFDATVSKKLSGLRRTRASILIPAPADEIHFLRCRLHIESLSLPKATD